jgi:hypothetical protein
MVTKIPQTAPAIGNQLARPRRIDQENRPHRHLFQQPANQKRSSFAASEQQQQLFLLCRFDRRSAGAFRVGIVSQ